jgi:hypothetical protein
LPLLRSAEQATILEKRKRNRERSNTPIVCSVPQRAKKNNREECNQLCNATTHRKKHTHIHTHTTRTHCRSSSQPLRSAEQATTTEKNAIGNRMQQHRERNNTHAPSNVCDFFTARKQKQQRKMQSLNNTMQQHRKKQHSRAHTHMHEPSTVLAATAARSAASLAARSARRSLACSSHASRLSSSCNTQHQRISVIQV